MHRWGKIVLFVGISVAVAGCPKGRTDFNQGRKAQDLQDYDAAFEYYQKALKTDPENAEYQIKFNQARFNAGELHIKNGLKLRARGELENAANEFQKATSTDASSAAAEQELRKTIGMIDDAKRASSAVSVTPVDKGEPLAQLPPEIKPLSRAPVNLKMSNDAKMIFDTIGKLAGLTIIYDPDFPARRVSVDLNNVTLEQALDVMSVESKAHWTPMTENIILVFPDQPQKRRDYEEQVMRTFYLSNTVQPQELTEVVTGLRQLLDLKRIQQLNARNAIVIRATPGQLALAEKFIQDIDTAQPEVVVQVSVLEARVDKMRNLGILPGQTATLTIVPPGTTSINNNNASNNGTNTGTTTPSTTGVLSLQNLSHLNSSDTSVTLPNFTANALLNDSTTRIIQNPELRSIDGQAAKLNIGDRVPVATGSFQAGVGVGSSAGGFVNPLVNTQFQYIDVGTNVEITPRVHPNHEVSLKVSVEVSSVTNQQNIGGIQQPIISQRKVIHDIRLKEGESSILGGLITKSDTKQINGWPGLAHVPILRYFFSEDSRSSEDDEILVVLTPHIVRMPEWTRSNLTTLYAGSETNVQVSRESDMRAPQQPPPVISPEPTNAHPLTAPVGNGQTPPNAEQSAQAGKTARLRFEPSSLSLTAGQTWTVGVVVDNVNDLFSIPFLLQYNPAVLSVEEVRHGGFLQAGDQAIAIVLQVDKEHGQAIISASRQPNTPGASGTGTVTGIVIKALAPGKSTLSIVQVNARDSQQRPIQLVTSEASVQVKP
jgi:general secretion pathway protein D